MKAKKILLVEDFDILRETAHNLLEREGYDVKSCRDGREGIHLYRKNHFDLVITDIFMPVCDGYELIDIIRHSDDEERNTAPSPSPRSKIIAMSGGNREIIPDHVMQQLQSNVDRFLKKPFPKSELLACIEQTLTMPQKLSRQA